MSTILSDTEILELYPYDDSEDHIKYGCWCGEDSYRVSRDLNFPVPAYFLSASCKVCGRPRYTFRRLDGNYEKRRRALIEREEARRESWKPWKPKEFLEFIEQNRGDK